MDIENSWRKPVNVLIGISVLGLACVLFSGDLTRRAAHAQNRRALEALQLEMPEEALLLLREAVATGPNVAEFHFNLASAYDNNRLEAVELLGIDAAELYREVLREAEIASSLSPCDEALALSYAMYFYVAEDYGVETDWRMAREAWERVLKIHKDNPDFRYGPTPHEIKTIGYMYALARIAIKQDKLEEACGYIQEGLELSFDKEALKQRWLDLEAEACR